jgi:hypothetical protein
LGFGKGCSEGLQEFARLELKEDGTGLLAMSFLPNSPAQAYRVKSWSQRGFQIDVVLEPVDAEAEPIHLTNVGGGGESLELEVHGRTWELKMTLFNEAARQKRLKAVMKAMEGMSKPRRKR